MSSFQEKAQEILSDTYNELSRPELEYPANHFAFRSMLNSFAEKDVQSIVEVGSGHGNAIPVFVAAGLRVAGFDNNSELVNSSKAKAKEFGLDPNNVVFGDIEDPLTYASLDGRGDFDGLVAMGVMPHVHHDEQSLINMAALVRPGGEVFIEFRNSLFSLITFNRFTHEFIMEELLFDVSPEIKSMVDKHLRDKFDVTKPGPASSKFHNPFGVVELFDTLGFEDADVIPFHYHAGMPSLESQNPQGFRAASVKLENESSGWRGLFLCSAFVVHAFVPEQL
jgi:2-polyprenyl-3-methyl-5-hydroxy-6-metoxy-1,4-benzoquinol methylase